ncbi:MAG: C39 family peptidase [Methanobacterium sp.]|jgi:predicted double-glycine peptidase
MQSTDYSCGPAALATVLQNMGINSTEQELKVLAGTDTSGTSMYGLVRAAHAKGLNAVGMKLSVDDLRPNNIVHIILDGEGHYSVIREVSENSVYLADPSLGNIEMTREKFAAIFTGNVLVISDPNMQVNQTAEQANNTNTSTVQAENQTLASEEMECIKGQQLSASANMQLSAETMQSIRGRVIWKKVAAIIAAALVQAGKVVGPILLGIALARWTAGQCIICTQRTPDGPSGDVFCTIHARRYGQVWGPRI